MMVRRLSHGRSGEAVISIDLNKPTFNGASSSRDYVISAQALAEQKVSYEYLHKATGMFASQGTHIHTLYTQAMDR
jgi:hypothetical protein